MIRDSAISPNGAWVVERLNDICVDGRVLGVSLRRPDEAPGDARNYLLSGKFDHPILPTILFRWIDDGNVLIATPERQRLEGGPGEFRGIRVSYDLYPDDPGVSRTAKMPRTISLPGNFIASFEKKDFAVGLPGVTCTFWLRAKDGKYFDNVLIRLGAVRTFAVEAIVRPGETKTVPERRDFSVLFHLDELARWPVMKMTSAKFDDIAPKPNTVFRESRPMNMAARPFPLYQIAYWGYSKDDIARMIEELRRGTFHVIFSFWLDDVELHYVSAAAISDGPVNEFERCLTENSFLSRPLEPLPR